MLVLTFKHNHHEKYSGLKFYDGLRPQSNISHPPNTDPFVHPFTHPLADPPTIPPSHQVVCLHLHLSHQPDRPPGCRSDLTRLSIRPSIRQYLSACLSARRRATRPPASNSALQSPARPFVRMSVCSYVHLSIRQSVRPPARQSVHPSVCTSPFLSFRTSVRPYIRPLARPVCPSVSAPACPNAACPFKRPLVRLLLL